MIILLERDRLKIRLDKNEAREHGLDAKCIHRPGAEIRAALVSLLQKACAETGFRIGREKLFAQVLPSENGGCVVYFTVMRGLCFSSGGFDIEPVVYAFGSALGIVRAARVLYRNCGQRIYKSSLYTAGGEYWLVVRAFDYDDRKSTRFLEEYARKIGSGEVLAAYMDEHCELLIGDNAIDVIGQEL